MLGYLLEGPMRYPSFSCLALIFSMHPGAALSAVTPPKVTQAPAGPYHVEGARLLDFHGRPYQITGTRLAPVTESDADFSGAPGEFGPLSATTIVTIRQRLNMNAVRLPVDAYLYQRDAAFRRRTRTAAETANHLELLVILDAASDSPHFWSALAKDFRDKPNVFFGLPQDLPLPAAQKAVDAIRAAGATQPIAAGSAGIRDSNLVLQVQTTWATQPEELERIARLSARLPVLVDGMDPEFFTESRECAAFPSDPEEAAQLVDRRLTFLDDHQISWTLSAYQPGHLISDYRYLIGTRLENGYSCKGERDLAAGLGITVLSHLWKTSPGGLFPVNCMLGGFEVARGAVVSTYGNTLADHLEEHPAGVYPTRLGGVSIVVTDSLGVPRLAPMLYAGGGWDIISFVVPPDSALGTASVKVVRDDKSSATGTIVIADISPGFWTRNSESRGEVIGEVTQLLPDGKFRTFDSTTCGGDTCHTVPVPLAPTTKTTIRMIGTGFRFIGDHPDIKVSIGGQNAKVLAFGPDPSAPYNDYLTVEIPDSLAGAGEVDVWFTVNGVLSNVVRVNCGRG